MILSFLALAEKPVRAEIIRCAKILDAHQQIEKHTQDAPNDRVLIIFDIDLTLIKAEHPALCRPNVKRYKQFFKEETSKLTPTQKDILLNLAMQKSLWSITEPETLNVVQHLVRKGIKTIALTASLSGKVGAIKLAEIQRFKHLKKLGFDFSKSFPCNRPLIFHEVSSYLDRYPTFYKGILFSNGGYKKNSKGIALLEFLKTMDFEPHYVVMLDDVKHNLKSVENCLAEYNPSIKFLGIEYTAGTQYKSRDISKQDFMTFWHEILNIVFDEYD